MHDMLEPRTFHVRMHNENVLHAMPLPVHTMDQCEYNLLNRQAARSNILSPDTSYNQKGSGERIHSERSAVTGIMTEDEKTMTETAITSEERTTIEIDMIVTTPQIMTEGETTDDIWNVRGTRTTDTTTEREIIAEKSVENRLESTARSRIQIRPLHNLSNGRWKITTGVVKIRHSVWIVRQNQRGSGLEGLSAQTSNTSKIKV